MLFPSDDFSAVPTIGWYEDPKDKDSRPEIDRQCAFLRDLKLIAPAVTAWAVPNAAKRSQWAAMQAKREGMRAGALDLTLVWNRGCAFMEWKDGKGDLTDNQEDMLKLLVRAGHHCGLFRQERSGLAWLRSIGAPFMVGEEEATRLFALRDARLARKKR